MGKYYRELSLLFLVHLHVHKLTLIASLTGSHEACKSAMPVFPRNVVAKVLGSLIDEAIKIDTETLGIFSVPVPKETFPDYYEIIKNPMDYGTFQKSSACVPFLSTFIPQPQLNVILSILQEQ